MLIKNLSLDEKHKLAARLGYNGPEDNTKLTRFLFKMKNEGRFKDL